MGSVLGGVLGGGQTPGQAGQQQAIQHATNSYNDYRQEAMQSRLNLLAKMMGPYQGANNMLETIWGDPNRKPAPQQTWQPPPQRSPGEQVGSALGGVSKVQSGPRRDDDPVEKFMDPLGIFGGGGLF